MTTLLIWIMGIIMNTMINMIEMMILTILILMILMMMRRIIIASARADQSKQSAGADRFSRGTFAHVGCTICSPQPKPFQAPVCQDAYAKAMLL